MSRPEIIEGMARALFVATWADEQERKREQWLRLRELRQDREGCPADSIEQFEKDFGEELDELDDIFRGVEEAPEIASMGEDWMDVAPETPQYAYEQAWRLMGKIETLNKCGWYMLKSKAAKADGYTEDDELPKGYTESLGHYLSMESLGHGVSWFDDHEEFELELPCIEFELEE